MNPITINQKPAQINQLNQIELTIEKKEEKEDNFIQQFISFIDKPKELTPDVFGQTINEIKNQNINPNQIIEKFSFSWTEDFLQECPNKTIELMLEETKSANGLYYSSTILKQLINFSFNLSNFTNMDTTDKIINTAFDNLTNPNENNTLKCFDFLISVFSDDEEIKEQLKTVEEKMTGKQAQAPLQLLEKLVEQTLIQQVRAQKQIQESTQQIQELIKELTQQIQKSTQLAQEPGQEVQAQKQIQESTQQMQKLIEQTQAQQEQLQVKRQQVEELIQQIKQIQVQIQVQIQLEQKQQVKIQIQEIKKLVLQKQMQQIQQVGIRQLQPQIYKLQKQSQQEQKKHSGFFSKIFNCFKNIFNFILKILNPFKWFE